MSDQFIVLIPEDPTHLPANDAIARGEQWCRSLGGEVELTVSDQVQFFDCGENFERVSCPACAAELETTWWQDRMDEDFSAGAGFALSPYATPCCGAPSTLHALKYDFPQGFGRFAISALNPSVADLDADQRNAIATIIGVPIRVILQRI